MEARPEMVEDEISLMDIYEFLRDGWKTIVGMTVLGLVAGLVIGFVLPAKFQASGLIEPARVGSELVETAATLTEKLRNSSYYSATTLDACQLSDDANPTNALIKNLNPRVERQSSFVAVKFDAASPALAKECLTAVIKDVIKDQDVLMQSPRAEIESKIRSLRLHLKRADELRSQQIALNRQRLDVARQKLTAAQSFVSEFETKSLQFDFRNDQFSASSLLLATLQSKQNEVKDLQLLIDELEMLVRSGLTKVDSEVLEFELEVAELNKSLEKPATQAAQYVLPVFASDQKVAPRRSIIAAVGLLAGGFLGLLVLIGKRTLRHIQQSELARKKQQAT
jgi:LPS O-antigen subunit length determinant protein (WzzB/FepE family)